MDAAAIAQAFTELRNANAALLAQVQLLQAAGPAGPLDAAALAAIGAAAGTAAASARPPSDHAKDLSTIDSWDIDSSTLTIEDFVTNCQTRFDLKRTPDAVRCTLILEKLQMKAQGRFKAFLNAAGDTGSRATTTWAELKAWMLSAFAPDALVESNKIEALYRNLEQRGSAEKFADAYRDIVSRINNNAESKQLHTQHSFIRGFVQKLKPGVRIFLVKEKFADLESAISSAILHDNLVFEAGRTPTSTPKARTPTTPLYKPAPSPYGSRNPSPDLPLAAILAALGIDPALARPPLGSASPAGAPPPQPGLYAVERDHSVAAGQAVPKMTDEIKAWCIKWRACFRCRQKNSTHAAVNCPRFPSARLSSIEEQLGQDSQGNV
jgi:hypothetical protein